MSGASCLCGNVFSLGGYGSKVHSVASFLNLGIKKAADFFQNLRQSWITETGAALCDSTRFYLI